MNLRRTSSWAGLLALLFIPVSSKATGSESSPDATGSFRWIRPNSDFQLWRQIQLAFGDELAPDVAKAGQSELDVYKYKYVQKVGLLDNSALVIIGHRPAKELSKENAWDEYHSAFNFDNSTRTGLSLATGLFIRQAPSSTLDNNHQIRIDHKASNKQNKSFRWLYDDTNTSPGLNNLPGFDNGFTGRTMTGSFADTYMIKPTWTNEFRFNYGLASRTTC